MSNLHLAFSKKKFVPILISLILILSITLFSHVFLSTDNKQSNKYENNVQYEFDQYCSDLFAQSLSSDWLSLHFYIENPENFDIDLSDPSLGTYSYKSMKESQDYYINQINYLKSIDHSKLYVNQKITYDTLIDSDTRQLDFGDLSLCSQILSPTTGIQAQLPVLFSEYAFKSKTDIDNYLTLLSCLPDYYKQICEFQKLKANNNQFISSFCCNKIIDQCTEFLNKNNVNSNIMHTSFLSRINKCSFLSKKEKTDYIKKDAQAIKKYIFPAYNTIINTLSQLLKNGYCSNEKGLCAISDGKDYYEYLVSNYTGSSKSVYELKSMIQKALVKDMRNLYSLYSVDPSLEDKINSLSDESRSPKEILAALSQSAGNDFPISNFNYSIKYVDESLADYLSPAFYMAPPIDSNRDNVIYINNSKNSTSQSLFTILAHEGIPGHMLQNSYFSSTNPLPIRHLINYGGYSEGWATYVELLSYQYQYSDSQLASALAHNGSFTLALYSLCDIGTNYEGWTRKKTYSFLSNYGVEDKTVCDAIYEAVIEEPANYLQYYVGYLEIIELRDFLLKDMGTDFNLKTFHKAFLSIGPTSFSVAKKWIKHYYNALK